MLFYLFRQCYWSSDYHPGLQRYFHQYCFDAIRDMVNLSAIYSIFRILCNYTISHISNFLTAGINAIFSNAWTIFNG